MALGQQTGGKTKGSRKTGGRKAGTPNKVTSDMKRALLDLFEDNWDQIRIDILSIPPIERLSFFERIMPFVHPKQVAIDHTTGGKGIEPVQIVFSHTPLSEQDLAEMQAIQEGKPLELLN